jgi:uncharacterized protein YbjT (DUF2867 family)
MVHREDERSKALSKLGAEVVSGDLTELADVRRAMEGCGRLYFGMSTSPRYLEATINTAVVAKHYGIELFLNISQMTVSEMSILRTTPSVQQKQQWLAEQALNWSRLPVVHVRPTVFLENPFFSTFAAASINRTGELQWPFGSGKSSPVATDDVARVMAEILAAPEPRTGQVHELTGPESLDMNAIAGEYSQGLGRKVTYRPLGWEEWADRYLKEAAFPDYVVNHLRTMALLHREDRYDRRTSEVKDITGKEATPIRDWAREHAEIFRKESSHENGNDRGVGRGPRRGEAGAA